MVWIALGAAGGIVAYRKGQQLVDEARARGVVGSLQAATGSAAGLAQGTRALVEKAIAPTPTAPGEQTRPAPRPSGTAAAKALSQARRAAETPAPSSAPSTLERSGRETS